MAQKNPWAWGKPYEAPKAKEATVKEDTPKRDDELIRNPDAAWAELSSDEDLDALIAQYMAEKPAGWSEMDVEAKKEWMELNLQPTPPNNDGARPELLVTDKEAPSAAADTNPMATAAAKQADAVEDMAKSGTKAKSAPASSKKTTSKK